MRHEAPISVLYFSNEFSRGGAEAHLLTLLHGLNRELFRLHLVCTPMMASELRQDLPSDVEVIRLSLRKPTQVFQALALAKVLREKQVDLLHSHMFYASLFASPIGWLSGVPIIFETPHVREQWRTGWIKSSYVIDRFVGQFVDHFIAVSKSNARYLMEEKRLPKKKIVVIRNGSDLERFDPNWPARAGLKRGLGFAEEDPVLLVIGRLEPQKGHSVLLKSLPVVRREFPNVRLVCVGEGSLRADLEGLSRGLGMEDSIRFVGFQSNMNDWLALSDISILPSFYEGLPLAAIESLAAGRPVIATAVDGTPEVVVNGVTGLTLQPGDSAALASAICALLRDPELRKMLGSAGRKWVLQHFSDKQQVRETEALYLHAWNMHQERLGLEPKNITLPADLAVIHSRLAS